MDSEKTSKGPSSNWTMADLSRRFRPALMAYFSRHLRDFARAEDLTQELFTRLLAVPDREMENPEAYLFRMASNLVRDNFRSEKSRAGYLDAVINAGSEIDFRSAERVLLAREQIGQVAALLDKLPERTRAIFICYRLESMSRKDIATAYGISVSAVEKQLAKAMYLLTTAIGGADE